ncbi:MAG: DUF5330 domain-containing protein [Hyphomicrobiaceae bacterium]|nr:MAG: DUF5330 domain-containing protein [Hyphomicrobiaceae bacterium]
MFIIRTVFWLGIIVLLLPADKAGQQRLTSAASEAYQRISTFCDRNGPTCVKAYEIWTSFKDKAAFGMELVGDVVFEKPQANTQLEEKRRQPLVRDTLQQSDLAPSWRAAERRKSN